MPKRTVVIGLLGPVLDASRGMERWERWRPTLSLCQHPDLLVDRLDLICEPKFTSLCTVLCTDIRQVSPETEIRSHAISYGDGGKGDAWDFEGVYAALHDFARSYDFRPDDEDYLIHITTGSHVAQICLFLLAESRHLPARLIQTAPPSKGTGLPGSYSIVDLDLSKYDRLASRFTAEAKESTSFLKSGIETKNPAFNRLIDQIEQVAINSKAPVLLMGPTGAGKSQLARRIFELKKQKRQFTGKFVEVNCATLRGDNAMSALFGHTRGAFTGAVTDRPGLLRTAHDGMLFLDEIGELGPDEQAMLLRAIEEKRFLPVGSDREAASEFALIAGTNRDLTAAARAGRFREDLLARINLWTFRLPALRDRREDLEPNLEYELAQFAASSGRQVTFNREARDKFLKFALAPDSTWAGNFRDLNAAVMRMATFADAGRITAPIVEAEVARLQAAWGPGDATESPAGADLGELLSPEVQSDLDLFDRVQLAEVVRVCQSSRTLSEAGRKLFAASRTKKGKPNDADRLRKYLSRFGLEFGSLATASGIADP